MGTGCKDAATSRAMGERDLFVLAEEVHVVHACDRAPAQRMHADLLRGAYARKALAPMGNLACAVGIDGLKQQVRL